MFKRSRTNTEDSDRYVMFRCVLGPDHSDVEYYIVPMTEVLNHVTSLEVLDNLTFEYWADDELCLKIHVLLGNEQAYKWKREDLLWSSELKRDTNEEDEKDDNDNSAEIAELNAMYKKWTEYE
eukprot:CAMPEP_0168569018 /NCGR_PEP_ID=MMETSP0413-20121227/15902_1 /TAXON_ID=136452 /ORGANISM="Filamoeba nolandi, Strain NC-AS-23-1" /LENGTH=122 /DNA_ID=CAMNT_0008601423 /DNA_START=92 /DNA_END=457 /DNA_ORIENTATION=-